MSLILGQAAEFFNLAISLKGRTMGFQLCNAVGGSRGQGPRRAGNQEFALLCQLFCIARWLLLDGMIRRQGGWGRLVCSLCGKKIKN